MITINLLPPEYRVSEKTPLPRIITVYVSVAIICGLGLWYGQRYFIDYPALASKETEVSGAIALLQPDLKEYNKLKVQKAGFVRRSDTIEGLVTSRVSVQQVLNETTSLIDPTSIWIKKLDLTKIQIATKRGRRAPAKKIKAKKGALAPPIMKLAMDCTITAPGEDVLKRIGEFLDIFKTHEYWSKAAVPPRFEGVKVKDSSGAFKLNILLRKPPTEEVKDTKKTIKKPLKKGGKA